MELNTAAYAMIANDDYIPPPAAPRVGSVTATLPSSSASPAPSTIASDPAVSHAYLPAAERGAFLDREAAGDPDLRSTVEEMLAGLTSDLIAPVIEEAIKEFRPPDVFAGMQMGAYELAEPIGKGGMGDKTLAACQEHGCVYLHAIGGAAQVLAECVVRVRNVSLLEKFGSHEAIWELEVRDFPAVVTMDSHGRSLHREVFAASQAALQERV